MRRRHRMVAELLSSMMRTQSSLGIMQNTMWSDVAATQIETTLSRTLPQTVTVHCEPHCARFQQPLSTRSPAHHMWSVLLSAVPFKKMVVDLTSKQSGLRSDCDIACDTTMMERMTAKRRVDFFRPRHRKHTACEAPVEATRAAATS